MPTNTSKITKPDQKFGLETDSLIGKSYTISIKFKILFSQFIAQIEDKEVS